MPGPDTSWDISVPLQDARDNPGDDTSDGQWVTYGELAKARNIERRAAVRLAQRRRWRRQAGNDGLTRVLVPPDWLKPVDRARDVTRDDAGDDAPLDATAQVDAVEVLQRALTMLGEQLARERDRGDVASAEVATLREQIAALQTDLAAAQATADRHYAALQQAEGVRDAALEAANRADAEAQAARDRLADMERDVAERRAMGRWAKLRDALRGR